jgi:hypothetical protein
MFKVKIYILIAASLFLFASPWLTPIEVNAEITESYCACCDGPCHGCCCSQPVKKSQEEERSGCSCKISDLPAIPDQPFDITETQNSNHSNTDVSHVDITDYHQPIPYKRFYSTSESPPDDYSPPLYILNTSFLI